VSAQNGKNSGDLLDEIVKKLPAEQDDETGDDLRIAVIGRPERRQVAVHQPNCSARNVSSCRTSRARHAIRSTRRSHSTAAA